jgi:microcin C transport system permease protein
MAAYIARRILLMFRPCSESLLSRLLWCSSRRAGRSERVLAQLSGADTGGSSRISGSSSGDFAGRTPQAGASADAVNFEIPRRAGPRSGFQSRILEKQFGFDKPAPERFALMVWNYARFDFGKSYFRDVSVIQLIKEKLPVSISLGLWLTFLTYMISIPLGVRKAVADGSRFDTWTSAVIIVGFADSRLPVRDPPDHPVCRRLVLQLVPAARADLRRLVEFPWYWKIIDYFWHITLPLIAMGLRRLRHHDAADQELVPRRDQEAVCHDGARQGLHRAPGALWPYLPQRHADRDRGLPGAFIHAFFSGSLLIETIFSLDGLGLLSFESVLNRDYPVVFGNLFIFSLVGLVDRPDLRPYLYVDRSPDRFRGAGGLMTMLAPQPVETSTQSPLGTCRADHAAPVCAVAAQPPAAGRTSRRTAGVTGRCGSSSCCSCLAVRRADRQRPAVLIKYDGISTGRPLSAILRPLSAAISRPRPTIAIPIAKADRGQGRLDHLAADPLLLLYPQSRPADAGAVASRPGC